MIQATVIIAAWNSETTLRASVESALAQRGVSLEIIVVDDCSTDRTRAVADELAAQYRQIRVLAQPRNGGPAAARNAALATATGTWIAVLDADDLLCPGRLAEMAAFGDRMGADVVCDELVIRHAGRDMQQTAALAFDGDPESRNWTVRDYIAGNMHGTKGMSLGYLKPIIRRAFVAAHGLRYDEGLRNGEDFHFVLEALALGAVMRFRAKPGYVYAVGQVSLSHRLNPDHAAGLARADLAFAARHPGRLGKNEIAMMQHRARSILDLASAETALAAVRDGDLIGAVRALGQRPQAMGRFFRQLTDAVAKRLGNRR